jgi:aspartate racemase
LAIGEIKETSNRQYWEIIQRLAARGAGGVILGCTEIPLLVHEDEGNVPLFDTTYIHAAAAVDYALAT